MFKTLLLLTVSLTCHLSASQLLHKEMTSHPSKNDVFIWEEQNITPFTELMISWDAQRPAQGHYLISTSLLTTEWSPWLDYAYWGNDNQYSFKQEPAGTNFKVYQDAAEVLNGEKAVGFKIRIQSLEGADLTQVRTLHACTTDIKTQTMNLAVDKYTSIDLPVKGLSQMALPDERKSRLCSPTSTTAVMCYLMPTLQVSALAFADKVYDTAFDIYGNWVLNTAQAAACLGAPWHVYVARLTSFDQIHVNLMKGYPVVVSVRGPLSGSAIPYVGGHLLVVKGYDANEHRVLCMDPAFADDTSTQVSYPLDEFLSAWNRRNGVAYLFYRS